MRPAVRKYFDFKDLCRMYRVQVEVGASITFRMPMPKSWSQKKKEYNDNQPHLQTPDLSNLLKALEDAVMDNDSRVWWYSNLCKVWGHEGSIEIYYPDKE